MKFKVTKKQLQNRFSKVIRLGHCQAQCLFPDRMAQFYNTGVYGWNFDGIAINDVLVVTGYRNLFGIMPDYKLVEEYEQKAQNINSYGDTHKIELYNLQQEFFKKVFA